MSKFFTSECIFCSISVTEGQLVCDICNEDTPFEGNNTINQEETQEVPMERTEVVLDGVTYLMTNEQIGNLEVEVSPEELEAIKLMLAREAGLPEPVLYDDPPILLSEEDREKELNGLIDVQERMSNGMRLIEEAKEKLLVVRKRLQSTKEQPVPYSEFTALIQGRKAWEERISLLWNKWFELQKSTNEVDSSVWGMYFSLVEEEISPYFTNGDSEDIDEQVNLFQTQNDVADALRDSHISDMED